MLRFLSERRAWVIAALVALVLAAGLWMWGAPRATARVSRAIGDRLGVVAEIDEEGVAPIRDRLLVAHGHLLCGYGRTEDAQAVISEAISGLTPPSEAALHALSSLSRAYELGLESEILAENVRPRYNWASGRTRYGDVETDARFFFCREQDGRVSYAFTEAVRLDYRRRRMFAAEPRAFPLQYVGEEIQIGIPKWRAWEGTARLE